MGKADLHVHTALGDGMAEIPELLQYVEEETDLSLIAITEHDDLRAAELAREAWARGHYRYQLILGEEVTTIEGHLLALFIEEPVPSLKPLAPTLEAVHRQGGLCIIAHPMSWLTRSIGQRTIERIQRTARDGVSFDGMETSGSLAARVSSNKATRLNRERYGLAEVGGSDAHFLQVVGASYTTFDGSSPEALRKAILARETSAQVGRYPSLRQIGLRKVAHQQWRGMMATPRKMGWLPTIGSFLRRARL
ncbi:MAG: PHP domain-containing protein [Nitrospinae bacterium]|nr:PHP domain-containing protein [Nitrospinota bacterium]